MNDSQPRYTIPSDSLVDATRSVALLAEKAGLDKSSPLDVRQSCLQVGARAAHSYFTLLAAQSPMEIRRYAEIAEQNFFNLYGYYPDMPFVSRGVAYSPPIPREPEGG